MAQATGTFDSYDIVGDREDLTNVIYNISPEETPFMTSVGRGKAKATKHEWQTDSLADASTSNAFVEGDEYSYADPAATTRVGNFTQISRKTVQVSGTLEAIDKAGRDSEMAYQMAKRSPELKRDMEAILLNNQASVAGAAATPRTLGGLPAWLETNTDRGVGGADGGYNAGTGVVDAATDGTQRAFTEEMLKDVIQQCFEAGATPKVLMLSPFNKRAFSAFTGISELRTNIQNSSKQQATIFAGADMYISDFGTLSVVPNRFQRSRDAFVLDTEYAQVAFLRPVQQEEVAKTGDARKRVILCEYTLVVKNEAAHGVIADLTTS